LREDKDFTLPRHFVSAAQEGAGGMRGGFCGIQKILSKQGF
jgi:hypothetical protein